MPDSCRQSQPFGRQQSHIDADIDKRLKPEPGTQTYRQISFEKSFGVHGADRQPEYSPEKTEEQGDEQE